MADLTTKQKATVDQILETYPQITPFHVNGFYEHHCFARNWFIYIEVPGVSFSTKIHLTRCDHQKTANDKAVAFRDYIAIRKAVQS